MKILWDGQLFLQKGEPSVDIGLILQRWGLTFRDLFGSKQEMVREFVPERIFGWQTLLDPLFPDLYSISLKKDAMVANCWVDDHFNRNLRFIRDFQDSEMGSLLSLKNLLSSTRLASGGDKILWSIDSKLSFSTSSMFNKLVVCTLS